MRNYFYLTFAVSLLILAACGLVDSSTPDSVDSVVPTASTEIVQTPTSPLPTPTSELPLLPTPVSEVPTATNPPVADSPTETPTSIVTECAIESTGSFGYLWTSTPEIRQALGCPLTSESEGNQIWDVQIAFERFENGVMIWSDHLGWHKRPVVYAITNDNSYQRYDDTYDPAIDPASGGETPPNGLHEPKFGFGKVWRTDAWARSELGWATEPEAGGIGKMQLFEGGEMLWVNLANETFIFLHDQQTVYRMNVSFTE